MRFARGLPKVATRSAWGWHEVDMRFAWSLPKVATRSGRGWHEVAQGLHEVDTRSAWGLHEVLHEVCMRFARGLHKVCINDELCDYVRSWLIITGDLSTICNSVVDICLDKVILWCWTNLLQTSCKPRADLVQTLCQPHADLVQTSCRPRANLVQTSCKPHANLVQTSCRPHATSCPRDLGKRRVVWLRAESTDNYRGPQYNLQQCCWHMPR